MKALSPFSLRRPLNKVQIWCTHASQLSQATQLSSRSSSFLRLVSWFLAKRLPSISIEGPKPLKQPVQKVCLSDCVGAPAR